MSIALKYGIFNLAYFGNAIILTRGNQNIIARDIDLFEFIHQGECRFPPESRECRPEYSLPGKNTFS